MIKNWQYLDAYGVAREEILAIVDRVFSSGRLILGKEVETFETSFSLFCGAGYGVGVNSGTDALFLALKALGVGEGDEVITVSNTAVPTVAAIRASGAMPVFVDVEEETFLMDIGRVEQAITPRTKCILPVHLFGQPVDMDPLCEIASRRGLSIIEDCAQAAGADYKGRTVGSIGDIGAFSFYPTKILGAYGDAGMAVTSRQDLNARLRRLRFYGMEEAYYSEEEGYNSRLDEVQAAILNFLLPRVGELVRQRKEIADAYAAGLSGIGDIELPVIRRDRSHQFYCYTVKTAKRNELMQYLKELDIETRINYPVPVHLMRGYSFLGLGEGALPVTERLAGKILSLPLYPGLPAGDAEKIIGLIRQFFNHMKA